jgi:hypothetical protein
MLVVQFAKAFLLAQSVELGGDDRGGALVGGPGELGVELQGGGALRVPEAPATVLRSVPAARSWVAEYCRSSFSELVMPTRRAYRR